MHTYPFFLPSGKFVEVATEAGYLDARQLCKAGGVKFKDYYRLEETQQYLKKEAEISGVSVEELIYKSKPYIWVHKDVWIHIAEWILPSFADQMRYWIGISDPNVWDKMQKDLSGYYNSIEIEIAKERVKYSEEIINLRKKTAEYVKEAADERVKQAELDIEISKANLEMAELQLKHLRASAHI